MRTVDDFAAIRQAHRDGLSIREIARQLGVGRDTVRKALTTPNPRPTPRPGLGRPPPSGRSARSLTPSSTPTRRPRPSSGTPPCSSSAACATSTATRRLRPGPPPPEDPAARPARDVHPVGPPAGLRAEADFGHIHVDFPDGRRLVPVLLVTWSYSNCAFAVAMPTERTEAILHGMVEAFAFFGCVPREVWWDNPPTVAIQLFRGRDRTCTRVMRPWPATTRSTRCSACRPGATRSPAWNIASSICNGAGPRPCRAWPAWTS